MSKIDKMLAVLDMGATIISASSNKPVIDTFDRERKQIEWLCANNIMRHKKCPETFIGDAASNKPTESLADLAFRLRDEVVDDESCSWDCWKKALKAVYQKAKSKEVLDYLWDWWVDLSQPIHWIVASLIAKELSNETNNRSKKM